MVEMSEFKFACPFCNQELNCNDSLENQLVKCPVCGEEIVPVREEADPVKPVDYTPVAKDEIKKTNNMQRASNKPKFSFLKKEVMIGASCGFLAGFLITFAAFLVFYGVCKKDKNHNQTKLNSVANAERTVQQKDKSKTKDGDKKAIPVVETKPEAEKEITVTIQPIKPVKKRIIPYAARKDMMQLKILTKDWSNPTPSMLAGMADNKALKTLIKPIIDYVPYPKTWDMELIKKSALCEIEDEPGEVYISGKIGLKSTTISLIFQKDDSDDKIEFGFYAADDGKVFIEFASQAHFLARKFNELANRFKSGLKKKKSEKIKIPSWKVGGHNYYGEIGFLYDPNQEDYMFTGKIYTSESGFVNVKMTGEEFSKMSLALLYAFKKLENHHLKRYYWYKKHQ